MSEKYSDLLVVSDVDGTLLQAGYGIPKENIDAIDAFVDNGGLFTLATGRSIESIGKYIDWLRLSAPAILCNGGLIYDFHERKVLFERVLDPICLNIVKDILANFPDIGVEISSGGHITVVRMNEYVHSHTGLEHLSFTLMDIDRVGERWNKVFFCGAKEKIAQLVRYFDRKRKSDPTYETFDYCLSSETAYEILPKGVNKGSGLKKLCEILGIDREQTVAIGDYDNDKEMLVEAGYSVAVADASPEIRAMADITVKSCLQGGVGELLGSLDNIYEGYIQLKLDM